MENENMTVEEAIKLIKELKKIILTEKLDIREAGEKFGIKKSTLDTFMKWHISDEYEQLAKEVEILSEQVACSKYAKDNIEGTRKVGKTIATERIYKEIIEPSFEMDEEKLERYKELYPLVNFEDIKLFHDMRKTGEISKGRKHQQKDYVIDRLKYLIKINGSLEKSHEVNKIIKKSAVLRDDEEIAKLLEEIEEIEKTNLEKKTCENIMKYIRKNNSSLNFPDKRYNGLILDIVELNEEERKKRYPFIKIDDLTRASRLIREKQEKEELKKDSEKYNELRKEQDEAFNEVHNIAYGDFLKYNITTQEQFEEFLEKMPNYIPDVKYKYVKLQETAKRNWNKLLKYREQDIEELEQEIKSKYTEIQYLKAYQDLIDKGFMCDYSKLRNNKTIEELQGLIELVNKEGANKLNQVNYKVNNPLYDIRVDEESLKTYEQITERESGYRYGGKREQNVYVSLRILENEIYIIDSVIKEKERLSGKEQVIEENKIPEINNEDNSYDGMSIEELLKMQEGLDKEIEDSNSKIQNLETSIKQVDDDILNEKKRQAEEAKRKELIESIKAKSMQVNEDKKRINELKSVLNEKQKELQEVMKDNKSFKGE